MIEVLCKMLPTAGIKRMNISLQSSGAGKVTIVVQSILGEIPNGDGNYLFEEKCDDLPSRSQLALRDALCQPLVIEGTIGEVDVRLEKELMDFVTAAVPAAELLKVNTGSLSERLKTTTNTVRSETNAATESVQKLCDEMNDEAVDSELTDDESL